MIHHQQQAQQGHFCNGIDCLLAGSRTDDEVAAAYGGSVDGAGSSAEDGADVDVGGGEHGLLIRVLLVCMHMPKLT